MILIYWYLTIPILLQLNVNIFYSVQKKISFLRISCSQTIDFFPISLLIYCSVSAYKKSFKTFNVNKPTQNINFIIFNVHFWVKIALCLLISLWKVLLKVSFICLADTDTGIDFMIPILCNTLDTVYNRSDLYYIYLKVFRNNEMTLSMKESF